jgi:hypothetical protein
MEWPILLGSVAAILAVSGLVAWLKLGEVTLDGPADACRWADELIPGFSATGAILSSDAQSALVIGQDQRLVLLKRHGAQFVGRIVARPLQIEQQGDVWQINSGERLFGRVAFGVDKNNRDKLLTLV